MLVLYPYWFARPGTPPGRAAMVNGRPMHFIESGLLFFSHGNPVGGPSEGYRGVSASSFPTLAVVLGPGAPLYRESTGIAGQVLYQPHIHGEPFLP